MPCYDSRSDEPRIIYQEDTAKVDRLTRMLCGLMTQLSDRNIQVDYADIRKRLKRDG